MNFFFPHSEFLVSPSPRTSPHQEVGVPQQLPPTSDLSELWHISSSIAEKNKGKRELNT